MSDAIDEMIGAIFAHEGDKYTETPGDAGGPTKFGITLRFVKGIPGPKFDIDGDGQTTANDIRHLDHQTAAELMKRYFYMQPMIYTLPVGVQPMMFDEAVNFGPGHAIMCLQKAVLVDPTGHIGDITRSCVDSAIHRLGLPAVKGLIVDQFVARYRAIVDARPGQSKFLKGWLDRANSWRTK